jgi:RNA polymerase sigma-70 factor, ECF subfamily
VSPEQRNALKLHVVEGVTLDGLARLYGVHRATAARWLARTKDLIVDRALQGLAEQLGIDRAEAASILRLVMSRLEVTITSPNDSAPAVARG